MLPFDRLIIAVDAWAGQAGRHDIFAQIGNTAYQPRNFGWKPALPPHEFAEQIRAAELIISHAGMGTIITALTAGKSIVLLPRLVANHEVTTDHQIHTANWAKEKSGIFVSPNVSGLPATITEALNRPLIATPSISASAPADFVANVRRFLTE
ncbi:glycosyltransferase [Piscinibacter sakaiensis]|uniref:glycosyltransferase n=1 Tax=Piscinibacter sakaiensis TaxID=1547922 RepID=UPI003AAB0E14